MIQKQPVTLYIHITAGHHNYSLFTIHYSFFTILSDPLHEMQRIAPYTISMIHSISPTMPPNSMISP